MDKDQIDSLIWGDFRSQIIEMKIPLFTSDLVIKPKAMDGAFALFNGFLTFLMYKLGYKPKLSESYKGNMDDNSWWIEYLDEFNFMGLTYRHAGDKYSLPPFIFKQFFNKIGKDIKICILLDWFSFYEINLILSKSKLDDDSKYTHKLFDEFETTNSNTQDFLKYMKDLRNEDFAKSHKLVLRPDKLSDFIITLDNDCFDYRNSPNNVYTKKNWNKMSNEEKIRSYGENELIFCKEDNFHQLLEKASIKIPNVEFVTFSEFVQVKWISTIQEWSDIRDKYIHRLKNSIKEPRQLNDFNRAKKSLRYAKTSLDNNNFNESIVSSSNAIEDILSIFSNQKNLGLKEKIKLIESKQGIRNHVPNLNYIRSIRNKTVHPNDFEVTEDITRHVLEMTNQFLIDVQQTI